MSVIGVPRHYVTHANGFPRAVPESVIDVVVEAIQYAWAQIVADPAFQLETPAPGKPLEDIYSDAICNILEDLLHDSPSPVRGFDSNVFAAICRGDHLGNYSGSSLNKKPDFIIRIAAKAPTSAARLVGILIESKVVAPKNPMSLYTDDGLLRFVNGDYAWAMQTGLMLAYQRANGRPLLHLTQRLHATQHLGTRRELAAPVTKGKAAHLSPPLLTYRTAPAMARSQHARTWTYTASNDAPGDIDVWHVWNLPVPPGY